MYEPFEKSLGRASRLMKGEESADAGERGTAVSCLTMEQPADRPLDLNTAQPQWTEPQHQSYLRHMEENFVSQMYSRQCCYQDICGVCPSHRTGDGEAAASGLGLDDPRRSAPVGALLAGSGGTPPRALGTAGMVHVQEGVSSPFWPRGASAERRVGTLEADAGPCERAESAEAQGESARPYQSSHGAQPRVSPWLQRFLPVNNHVHLLQGASPSSPVTEVDESSSDVDSEECVRADAEPDVVRTALASSTALQHQTGGALSRHHMPAGDDRNLGGNVTSEAGRAEAGAVPMYWPYDGVAHGSPWGGFLRQPVAFEAGTAVPQDNSSEGRQESAHPRRARSWLNMARAARPPAGKGSSQLDKKKGSFRLPTPAASGYPPNHGAQASCGVKAEPATCNTEEVLASQGKASWKMEHDDVSDGSCAGGPAGGAQEWEEEDLVKGVANPAKVVPVASRPGKSAATC